MDNKDDIKSIFKSKTFWLNALALVLVILTGIENQISAGITLSVMSVLNIILRSVTNEAVKWK